MLHKFCEVRRGAFSDCRSTSRRIASSRRIVSTIAGSIGLSAFDPSVTCVGIDCTYGDSETFANSSVRSTCADSPPASRTESTFTSLKPVSSARTEYSPDSNPPKLKKPWLSVTPVRAAGQQSHLLEHRRHLQFCATLTVTPGSVAPVRSVTVPLMDAVNCESALRVKMIVNVTADRAASLASFASLMMVLSFLRSVAKWHRPYPRLCR